MIDALQLSPIRRVILILDDVDGDLVGLPVGRSAIRTSQKRFYECVSSTLHDRGFLRSGLVIVLLKESQ